jgi:hypothetical protein
MRTTPSLVEPEDLNVVVDALFERIAGCADGDPGSLNAEIREIVALARDTSPRDCRVSTLLAIAESFVALGRPVAALEALRNVLLHRLGRSRRNCDGYSDIQFDARI